MAKRVKYTASSFVTFPDGTTAMLTELKEDGTIVHHDDALTPEEWEYFNTMMSYRMFQAEKAYYYRRVYDLTSTDEWILHPPAPVGRFAKKASAETAT